MTHIQLFEKKIIHRKQGIPYLIRWTLFGIGKDSKYFSVKIHHILVSDEECLHNHPWAFVSILLKGSYTEYTRATMMDGKLLKGWSSMYFSPRNFFYIRHKKFSAGNILIRPANWAHRLKLNKPVWTLVFTMRKTQSWGFFTLAGFIHHSKYSEARDC